MRMPLPSFSWANGAEVWQCMLEKDSNYAKLRNPRMLDRHPSLVDSYRTILFDWLSEVSQECKFHRETYHLALDFIDRYLSNQCNVGKLQLQLIGTTCLFSAAKFEEIRPPTVQEFADLTDGACRAEDILDMEVNILSAINWDITPMTPNSWLNLYMQILLNLDDNNEKSATTNNNTHKNQSSKSPRKALATRPEPPAIADENSGSRDFRIPQAIRNDSFILPTSNGISLYTHKRIASVIDLALLHIESLRFSNSVLSASALFYFTDEITFQQCTGYTYNELIECINWLEPFVGTIKEIKEPVFMASYQGEVYATQMHSHIATACLLEKTVAKMETTRRTLKRKACTLMEDEVNDSENDSLISSPLKPTTVLLTPPSSTRKSRRIR